MNDQGTSQPLLSQPIMPQQNMNMPYNSMAQNQNPMQSVPVNQQPQMMPQPYMPQNQPSMPIQPQYPPQQQAVVSQPVVYVPVQTAFIYVDDPLAELSLCTGVLLEQKLDLLKELGGCETEIEFHCYGINPLGRKYLFKCQEVSSCCSRHCCPPSQREFNMLLRHITRPEQLKQRILEQNAFTTLFKPFKCCTCCCCNRPEMVVQLNTKEGKKLCGRIVYPCTVCDVVYSIYDEKDANKYTIDASCCQCGLMCSGNCCGKLSEADFPIYSNGIIVGHIKKIPAGNLKELMTTCDSFVVEFPKDATPYDKLLLIANALMINYMHFEKREEEKNETKISVKVKF